MESGAVGKAAVEAQPHLGRIGHEAAMSTNDSSEHLPSTQLLIVNDRLVLQ